MSRLTQNEWRLLAEAVDYSLRSPEFVETIAYGDGDTADDDAIDAVADRLRRIGEKIDERIRD